MEDDRFLDFNYQEEKFIKDIESFQPFKREKVLLALGVSKEQHSGQLRHSGEPYVIHPLRAALILFEELNIEDIDSLCALLLHDVCEDGSLSIKDIGNQFGSEIARLVKGLSRVKPENETEEQKKESKIKNIQKIAQADAKTRLTKLCDILDNARSWNYIPKDNPNYKKIPRWKNELSHYLLIAKNTNPKLFGLLSERI